MLHFTVKPYDPSLDYKRYCQRLYGDNKCLAMLEEKGGHHLHVQGEPVVDTKGWEQIQREMINEHYIKKTHPRKNPVKKRTREADDTGFQYMAKELPTSVVIYKQQFTDEDLQELYEQSNAHREELQSKPGEYIFERIGAESGIVEPSKLHERVCYYALEYYLAEGKMRPPNIKILCEHWLAKYWGDRHDVKLYISKRWV